MLRTVLVASAPCMTLTMPTLADDTAEDIPVIPPRAEVMAAASGVPVYRHLDCVTHLIERALADIGDEDRTATMTKEQLNHLRTRVFWARDAAARIGR